MRKIVAAVVLLTAALLLFVEPTIAQNATDGGDVDVVNLVQLLIELLVQALEVSIDILTDVAERIGGNETVQ